MSTVRARLYDYPVAVTLGIAGADPAGPFAGAVCSVAGTAVFYPLNGPSSQIGASVPVTMQVIAGQYLDFPIARFHTNTTATMLGLVAAAVTIPGAAGPNTRI